MKMKVLKGLEALKYMVYRLTLNYIIDKTFEDYGIEGLIELLDFIQAETE